MNKPMPVTSKCFGSHMGIWMIEPNFLRGAVSAIRSGMWQGIGSGNPARADIRQPLAATPVRDPDTVSEYYDGDVMYSRTDEGVAVIEMIGAMQKGRSKFGGVSTVDQRKYLRAAVNDPLVGSILQVVDSPGGTVAGTQSLADDVRAADAIKPVITHIEDLCASAMSWVGFQGRRVSANRSALVGSLGTYGVIEDTSKKAEMEGIEVIVISTGPHKGSFVDGTKVTKEQIAEYQRIVDALNEQFIQAVSSGRRMSEEKTRGLFDGRVHLAGDAMALGLIDAVESLDGALAEATKLANPPKSNAERARRTRMAGLSK